MDLRLLFYGVMGTVTGSFLNVCIDRLPADKSIISPPSHCPACQRRLTALELIPVVSYIFLRGRCRDCGQKIPLRMMLVELGTGLAFILIWLQFQLSWTTLIYSVYCSILIVIGMIDLEKQLIPNRLVFPAIGIALIALPFTEAMNPGKGLLGGLLGFAVLLLIALISPGAMGMGDVKLAIFIGLAAGYPLILLVMFMAFVLGGIIAGLMLILKKVRRGDAIAFGPYLALAGMIALLYGDKILAWWLRRMGL